MQERIVVPPLGEAVSEVIVDQWLVVVGELVTAGQTLLALESDKASYEVRALEAGRIAACYLGAGATVREGDVLGAIEPLAAIPPAPPTIPVSGPLPGSLGEAVSAAVAATSAFTFPPAAAPNRAIAPAAAVPAPDIEARWEVRILEIPARQDRFDVEPGWEPFGVLDARRIVLRRPR